MASASIGLLGVPSGRRYPLTSTRPWPPFPDFSHATLAVRQSLEQTRGVQTPEDRKEQSHRPPDTAWKLIDGGAAFIGGGLAILVISLEVITLPAQRASRRLLAQQSALRRRDSLHAARKQAAAPGYYRTGAAVKLVVSEHGGNLFSKARGPSLALHSSRFDIVSRLESGVFHLPIETCTRRQTGS